MMKVKFFTAYGSIGIAPEIIENTIAEWQAKSDVEVINATSIYTVTNWLVTTVVYKEKLTMLNEIDNDGL